MKRGVAARAAALLAVAAGGCLRAPPPVTAVSLPDVPRKPDGVVLEPEPAVPEVSDRAPTGGVVALREPLGGEAVALVVRALFHAFEKEDADALAALLVDDPVILGAGTSPGGGRGPRAALLDLWRGRLKSLDYSRLAGSEVARLDRLERYEYDDLGGAGAPPRPVEMKPGELLLRIPIAMPRVGTEQLFGDVVILLLRRDGSGFKISGFGEENGP